MAAKLKFYDVKAKRSFSSAVYKPVTKSGRKFAVATTPSGGKAYRTMPKA